MQLFPAAPAREEEAALSLACRDGFVLPQGRWSYPLTSCVSLNGSALQIHLQPQLHLSELLFHLPQHGHPQPRSPTRWGAGTGMSQHRPIGVHPLSWHLSPAPGDTPQHPTVDPP